MRFLLDVNALIAFGVTQHQVHRRIANWIYSQRGSVFLTTPITEIGFVRVVSSVPIYDLNVARARNLLLSMKSNLAQPLTFLPDAVDISSLPPWVISPAQVTDGHLAQLAAANDALLATLDKGIPGAFLIP